MTGERAYLDWNATAPLRAGARSAMLKALDRSGNPSSVHGEGREARKTVEEAREAVAALVGASARHVVFTSGATEAANHVLTPDFRMGRSAVSIGHLYVGAIEHACVLEGGRFPDSRVSRLGVHADGTVDLDALRDMLDAHDAESGLPMVALQLANSETGVIQPVPAVAEIVKAAKGILVVDAVQAVGRIPVSLPELGADFLFFSSHKIGGPKGAGALISSGEVLMPAPLLRGGGQEKGHRSGTENIPAVAGFGAAAMEAANEVRTYAERVGAVRDRIETHMRATAGDVVIHGADAARIANTSYFSLPGLKAETGQIAFDLEGIALSAGSACSSGKVGRSHVIEAMGGDAELGALRVSIGLATNDDEIDRFLAAFARIAGRRRTKTDNVEAAA